MRVETGLILKRMKRARYNGFFFDIYYYFSHFLNGGIPKNLASSLIIFLKNHESQSKEIARLDRSKHGNIWAAFTSPALIFARISATSDTASLFPIQLF